MNRIRGSLAGVLLATCICFMAGSLCAAAPVQQEHHYEFTDTARLQAPAQGGAAHDSAPWLVMFLAGLGALGATGTVTYRCPKTVKGTTTAPTAAQVANLVVADVAMGDAATITNVTHNLPGVSTDGADGSPCYMISTLVAGATPVGTGVTVAFTTNALQLSNLTTAAGNGQTYRVHIWRHAIISNFQN